MRKLKLQVQISVDGYVAGLKGELDWMIWEHSEELIKFINELTDSSDTILLGRKMTSEFITYWENVQPDSPEYDFAQKMVNTPKVVFTNSLDEVKGKNLSLAKGKLDEEIAKLKQQEGKDIVVYGGAEFVSSLIAGGHIDEFNFFINPVMINQGLCIFDLLGKRQKLHTLGARAYDCGVVVVRYELDKS